jgi:IMP dehydrogenase
VEGNERYPVALTFDDILLLPGESDFVPAEADVRTRVSKAIPLHIPVLSAAMDTVTEAITAIAMAKEGGLGIIHRNMPIDRQAKEVERVKKSESWMIVDPVTLQPEATLFEAIEIMDRHKISGVPVTRAGKLVGILTHRDLRFVRDLDRPVDAAMTKDVVTANETTTLEQAMDILQAHKVEKLPVVDSQGNLKGLITAKDIQKAKEAPFALKDVFGRLRVGAAVGVGDVAIERAQAVIKAGCDMVAIDTAHGHSRAVRDTLMQIKRSFPKVPVLAGNVATSEGARFLIEAGADAIKVGVGPGSICTTRVIAGVGVPQLSAVLACAKVTREAGVPLIADGGIKYSGDVIKALAAGADAVMIGNLFAGTDESPGDLVLYRGRAYKVYRGMGSIEAMKEGSADRYFQASGPSDQAKFVPEGIEGRVPLRGPLKFVLQQLVGGLKSGMGYVGARTLEELRRKAKMVRISPQGLRESHVHDVVVTREAPNYPLSESMLD